MLYFHTISESTEDNPNIKIGIDYSDPAGLALFLTGNEMLSPTELPSEMRLELIPNSNRYRLKVKARTEDTFE